MSATLTLKMADTRAINAAVRQRFEKFEDNARGAMMLAGMGMMEQVSELSPYDTNFMSSHVTYTPQGDDRTRGEGFVMGGRSALGFTVGWHAEDFHAEGLPFYPVFQEFGTIHHAAQPSLGPVAREGLPDLQKDIAAVFVRSFR